MIAFLSASRLLMSVAVTCSFALADGRTALGADAPSESKPETPAKKESESKPKEPDTKAADQKPKDSEPKKEPEPTTKELEQKLKELEQKVNQLEPKQKEQESKPKEPESKPKEPEPKAKETEQKAKEPEPKSKEAESRPKEPEAKPKETDSKQKEGIKPKEADGKAKEPESKPKEPDVKAQEAEAVERPCPQPHPPAEGKPAPDGQPPAEAPPGDKPKAAETETKKPMRSPMVTAKLALMADARLFPYEIEVDTKDKDLVLLGKVANDTEKRAATDIIRCLDGVHAVENRLKVEPDASHGLVVERDKIITHLVKERFEKSKTLQSVKFEVKTEDGVVTLTGSTRFQVIILEAAQAARQVPGVKAVHTDAVRLVTGD
jgi:hyperosmotically inducible protein